MVISINDDTHHEIFDYVVTNSYDVKENLMNDKHSGASSSSWNAVCAGTKGRMHIDWPDSFVTRVVQKLGTLIHQLSDI